MLKRLGWQRHCDDESVHRYSAGIIDRCHNSLAARKLMTSEWLSCWHLKSYRERLGMNGVISVYLRLREDSITNQQWYFAIVNITRDWIHVRDDRFSKFRNKKNLRSLESFAKWRHILTGTRNVHSEKCLWSLQPCQTSYLKWHVVG